MVPDTLRTKVPQRSQIPLRFRWPNVTPALKDCYQLYMPTDGATYTLRSDGSAALSLAGPNPLPFAPNETAIDFKFEAPTQTPFQLDDSQKVFGYGSALSGP